VNIRQVGWTLSILLLAAPSTRAAEPVTFSKDIAPIVLPRLKNCTLKNGENT